MSSTIPVGLTGELNLPFLGVRPSPKLTYMPFSWWQNHINTLGVVTYFLCIPLDDAPTAIRLIFGRTIGGSDTFVQSAAVVPSATFNDYVNPTGGFTPSMITWNNHGTDDPRVNPFNPQGNITSRTIPAGPAIDPLFGDDSVMQPDLSDWIALSDISPDGADRLSMATPACLMIRVCLGNTEAMITPDGILSNWTGNPAVNNGKDMFLGILNGDHVTDFPVVVPPGVHGVPVLGWQLMFRRKGVTVFVTGDSKPVGHDPAFSPSGWPSQLWAGWPGDPILGVANGACNGSSSARMAAHAAYLMPIIQPQIAFLQSFTFLDADWHLESPTLAMPRAQALAAQVMVWGGVPVLVGPYASNVEITQRANAATLRSAWQRTVDRLNAMPRWGTLRLDPASATGIRSNGPTRGTLTGDILPEFTSDGQHLNHAGAAVIAKIAVAIVRVILRA
jgi:lysophospholipase L1-like esterase